MTLVFRTMGHIILSTCIEPADFDKTKINLLLYGISDSLDRFKRNSIGRGLNVVDETSVYSILLFEAIAFLLEIQSAVGLFLLLLFISISNSEEIKVLYRHGLLSNKIGRAHV